MVLIFQILNENEKLSIQISLWETQYYWIIYNYYYFIQILIFVCKTNVQ